MAWQDVFYNEDYESCQKATDVGDALIEDLDVENFPPEPVPSPVRKAWKNKPLTKVSKTKAWASKRLGLRKKLKGHDFLARIQRPLQTSCGVDPQGRQLEERAAQHPQRSSFALGIKNLRLWRMASIFKRSQTKPQACLGRRGKATPDVANASQLSKCVIAGGRQEAFSAISFSRSTPPYWEMGCP